MNLKSLEFIYYNIYLDLMKTGDEEKYISWMKDHMNMSKYAMFFSKISHIKKLLFYLEEKKFINSFKITLLFYVKSDLFAKIIKFVLGWLGINKKALGGYLHNVMILEVFLLINKVIKLNLKYAKSFKQPKTIFGNKPQNQKYIDLWQSNFRDYILIGLVDLTKNIGYDILKKSKVELVKYHIFESYTLEQATSYYNDTMTKFKKYMEKNNEICDAYFEIEKAYFNLIKSKTYRLELHKYQIIIE